MKKMSFFKLSCFRNFGLVVILSAQLCYGGIPFVMPSCPNTDGELPFLIRGDVLNCKADREDCPEGYRCTPIEHYTGCCKIYDSPEVSESSEEVVPTTESPSSTTSESTTTSTAERSTTERTTGAVFSITKPSTRWVPAETTTETTAATRKNTRKIKPSKTTFVTPTRWVRTREPRTFTADIFVEGSTTRKPTTFPSFLSVTPRRWRERSSSEEEGSGIRILEPATDGPVSATRKRRPTPRETTSTTAAPLINLTPKRWAIEDMDWRNEHSQEESETRLNVDDGNGLRLRPTPNPDTDLLVLTPKRWFTMIPPTPWIKITRQPGSFLSIRKKPADGNPCLKQLYRDVCPDGKNSQYTLRWYLKDGMCCSYAYGHCKGEEVAFETALRTRAACEEVCLGKDSPTSSGSSSGSQTGTNTLPGRSGEDVSGNVVSGNGKDNGGGKSLSLDGSSVQGLQIASDGSKFTCEKQPFRLTCESGRKSQYTLRWYLKDGMCCSYPWGHCKGDDVANEAAIRTREECRQLCETR